jgi:ABC-type amino acid transport substrate-binding protein
MKMTSSNFGFGDAVFAVNKNRPELLEEINKEIEKLQESLETERICKKYMPGGSTYLCVL